MHQCIAVLAATLPSLCVNAQVGYQRVPGVNGARMVLAATWQQCQPSLDLWLKEGKNWDASGQEAKNCFNSLDDLDKMNKVYSVVCGAAENTLTLKQKVDKLNDLTCVQNGANWNMNANRCNCD